MTYSIILTTFVAGLFYVIIPGPATLAALNLSVTTGHRACASFLACHLMGDLAWAFLAIYAIVGVSYLGPALFDLLGIVCGVYLVFLGYRAWKSSGSTKSAIIGKPWKAGLLLGFTNPKAYPFALAMFTAVFSRFDNAMTLSNALPLVLSAFTGFVAATVFVVVWTNLPLTRHLYSRYKAWMAKVTGLVFIAFGCKSIVEAMLAARSREIG